MKLGPFDIGTVIGTGGYAVVHEAIHRATGTQGALKILTRTDGEDSMMREIQTIARLSHPHIVRLLDVGQLGADSSLGPEHSFYFLMERCETTLMDPDVQPKDWPSLRRLLRSLLGALAHAHARGVVHCDIKPSNILFKGGQPVLADYGIAFVRGEERTTAGTRQYMSPEQHFDDADALGPWSDLFALGVIAWRLAGSRPWPPGLTSQQIIRYKMTDARLDFLPTMDLPKGFHRWLTHMTHGQWTSRYLSAAAALAGLDELAQASVGPQAQPTAFEDEATRQAANDAPPMAPHASLARAPSLPLPKYEWQSGYISGQLTEPVLQGTGLLRFCEPAFVGRIQERKRLWQALVTCRTERRSDHELLEGDDDIGKRRLARWLARRASEVGGAKIAEARANESPYQTQLQILGELLGITELTHEAILNRMTLWVKQSAALNRTIGRLLQPASLVESSSSLHQLIGLLSETVPVVVVVPDLHDNPSLASVWQQSVAWRKQREVLGQPSGSALWIGTARGQGLAPLPDRELQQVYHQWASHDESTVARVLQQSTGGPGKLRQLLLTMSEQQAPLDGLSQQSITMLMLATALSPGVRSDELQKLAFQLGVRNPALAQIPLIRRGLLLTTGDAWDVLPTDIPIDADVLAICAESLQERGSWERAGTAWDNLGRPKQAIEAWVKLYLGFGWEPKHVGRRCLDLARDLDESPWLEDALAIAQLSAASAPSMAKQVSALAEQHQLPAMLANLACQRAFRTGEGTTAAYRRLQHAMAVVPPCFGLLMMLKAAQMVAWQACQRLWVAEAYLRVTQAMSPKDVASALAQVIVATNDKSRLSELEHIVDNEPTNPRFEITSCFLTMGDTQRALDMARRQMARLVPDFAYVYVANLALCLALNGHHHDAAVACDQVKGMSGTHQEVFQGIALLALILRGILSHEEQLPAQLADLDHQAIAHPNNDTLPYVLHLGLTHAKTPAWRQALQALATKLDVLPTPPGAGI